ncbi:MAG: hypothetical protein AB1523_13590 [Bacillota bacterium]
MQQVAIQEPAVAGVNWAAILAVIIFGRRILKICRRGLKKFTK